MRQCVGWSKARDLSLILVVMVPISLFISFISSGGTLTNVVAPYFHNYFTVLGCLILSIRAHSFKEMHTIEIERHVFIAWMVFFFFTLTCLDISFPPIQLFTLLILLLYQKALPALNNRLITWSYTPVTILFLSSRIVCLGLYPSQALEPRQGCGGI